MTARRGQDGAAMRKETGPCCGVTVDPLTMRLYPTALEALRAAILPRRRRRARAACRCEAPYLEGDIPMTTVALLSHWMRHGSEAFAERMVEILNSSAVALMIEYWPPGRAV